MTDRKDVPTDGPDTDRVEQKRTDYRATRDTALRVRRRFARLLARLAD